MPSHADGVPRPPPQDIVSLGVAQEITVLGGRGGGNLSVVIARHHMFPCTQHSQASKGMDARLLLSGAASIPFPEETQMQSSSEGPLTLNQA